MKIFIAGGGTGGHIYPALAIADSLKKINSEIHIEFVGTAEGLEAKIISKENYNSNYKLNLIQSGKLNFEGNILVKIKTLVKIPIGIFESVLLILKNKPDFVLGVGGYVSAPFVLAAALMGCKCAFWEPNAHPGMANRILSRFVKKSYLVFSEAKNHLYSKNNLVFGMPLRAEMLMLKQSIKKTDKFFILCFGGSQGSQFLNEQLSDFILNSSDLHKKIQVVHQTGPKDFERMKKKYENIHCVQIFDFIYNMSDYYQQADVLFCRGGASTLAEAAAFGIVPIIVPLPAADNHQQKNAESLIEKNAAFMFTQKQFNANEFKKILNSLIENKNVLSVMSENIQKLISKNASAEIAADIIKEIQKS